MGLPSTTAVVVWLPCVLATTIVFPDALGVGDCRGMRITRSEPSILTIAAMMILSFFRLFYRVRGRIARATIRLAHKVSILPFNHGELCRVVRLEGAPDVLATSPNRPALPIGRRDDFAN